jgi:hypothetical protein
MADGDLLVLRYEGLAVETDGFFRQLDADQDLRTRFLTNPTGVLLEHVPSLDGSMAEAEIAHANRVLFALLSNERFMAWARDWANRHQNAVTTADEDGQTLLRVRVDREQLYRDLADAIWEHGDRELLSALLNLEADAAPGEEVEVPDSARLLTAQVSRRRPPGGFSVNVNTNVNVNVTVSITFIGIAVVVIPVLVIGAPPEGAVIHREALAEVVDTLTQQLQQRSQTLRSSGQLRSLES